MANNSASNDLPPKLPLPNIELTLKRYLNAVETFTPPDQFSATSKLVQDFLDDQQKTQAIMDLLRQKENKEESWAYKWWLEDMYLKNMLPLPINSNPGWVFPKQKFNEVEDMLKYMSKLIIGLGNFKQKLENNDLPAELAPGKSGCPKMKLCLKQYERMLNAYRKPGDGLDNLETSDAKSPRENEHIIVMGYGQLYKMPIKSNEKWLSFQEVFQLLLIIQSEAIQLKELPLNERVPLLTSEKRNVWFEAREELLKIDPTNVEVLNTIESCLFIVCLDHAPQNSTDVERSQKDMFKQMLTGLGTRYSGSNRWFDKTVQLIVSMDGANGMCYEHTASEGVAVVSAVLNIFNSFGDLNDQELSLDSLNLDAGKKFPYKKLDFKLNDEIKKKISLAGQHLDELNVDTDDEVFIFEDFGKSFIKTCNCSPDAFMQMSLQLAYYRLNGSLCPTYESASTRRFQYGRVDSIRASHPEALEWTKAMMDSNLGKEEKRNKLKIAIAKQTKVTKENIFGEGVDVPLLGIQRAAQELWPNETLPLFEDPTFENANKFKLSTSQVPINLPLSYMGYGAVVPDGYGISYNLQDCNIIYAICSFFSCQSTNSRRFCEALTTSLKDMKELFIEE